MTSTLCDLENKPPNYDSAAEDIVFFRIPVIESMVLLCIFIFEEFFSFLGDIWLLNLLLDFFN